MDDEEADKSLVSMITPFVITLDELDKNEDEGQHIKPITIQLSID